jgi:hypothetical protein
VALNVRMLAGIPSCHHRRHRVAHD